MKKMNALYFYNELGLLKLISAKCIPFNSYRNPDEAGIYPILGTKGQRLREGKLGHGKS